MIRRFETVAEAVETLRAQHPCAHGAGWDFDGFKVWVESDEPALITELELYFSDFIRLEAEAAQGPEVTRITAIQVPEAPDLAAGRELTIGEYKPTVRGPKEGSLELPDGRIVKKLRTGMWFVFGREHHLAIGPCTDNPNQVVNFVNNRKIQAALHDGALLGHAAAVGLGGRDGGLPEVVAIAGFSGMGKSTLSLHLMNDRRLDFLSNDRIMIGPRAADPSGQMGGLVYGVPKHPRINPGTILNNPDLAGILSDEERARFSGMPLDELWALEHKYDGLIRACFPSQRFRLRGQLRGLILLNWRRGAGETVVRRIDPAARPELLPALMKAPGSFYLPDPRPGSSEVRDRTQARYVEFLRGVEVVELAGGIDFERGCAAGIELLGL